MTYEFETCRLSGEGNTIFPDEIIIDDEEAVVIHRKPKLIGCRETKMHIDYLPPKSRPAALYGKRPFTDDGLFFQIEGGLVTRKLNHTSGYDTDNSSLNTDWGVALGYQFNALSAVRMAFNLQDCKDRNTGLARSLNISGSYMLNLSNLLLGYDPDDRFSTNLYVGPQGSYQSGLKKWRFGGIAGVQFGYRLNSHMTTYFAPELVSYLPDKNGDHSSRVSYKVGLTYRFNSGNSQLEKLRWFINLGAGVGLAPDAPVGSGNSLGANYRVSLGAWMTDALALRLTGVAAQNRWEQSSTDYFRYHHYYGGRLQLMLDPLTILHSYDKEDAQAGFYLAVGPDLGATYFQSGGVWTHRCTLGLAASVQAWARVGNHTRVFLEPDLSFQKYGAGKGGFYNNKLMSFNLGVSMDITNYPQNTKGKVEKKYNFFAQLGAGTAFDMLNGSHEGTFSLHPSYQITLGYNVDDLSAFRLVVGYNDKKKGVALADQEFDVAYQLNLNNAFTGVDSTRKFDVSMYGGLSFISTPSLSTVAVGSLIGAQANYKLSKGLYLYLSLEARIKHSKYRIMLGIGKYF